MMRRFVLVRHVDPTGISGTGKVAEGVQWPDGVVAMQWCRSPNPLPMPYPSIDVLLRIHGHGGSTVVEWVDEEYDSRVDFDSACEEFARPVITPRHRTTDREEATPSHGAF